MLFDLWASQISSCAHTVASCALHTYFGLSYTHTHANTHTSVSQKCRVRFLLISRHRTRARYDRKWLTSQFICMCICLVHVCVCVCAAVGRCSHVQLYSLVRLSSCNLYRQREFTALYDIAHAVYTANKARHKSVCFQVPKLVDAIFRWASRRDGFDFGFCGGSIDLVVP